MKFSVAVAVASVVFSTAFAFTPIHVKPSSSSSTTTRVFSTVEEEKTVKEEKTIVKGPIVVDKPTGTSFLPEETVARCEKGNPTEKVKLKKDPINSWVDIYEYARKIREGEMTWSDIEKADLDTVSSRCCFSIDNEQKRRERNKDCNRHQMKSEMAHTEQILTDLSFLFSSHIIIIIL
jgi:hypothetical protein